MGLFTVAGIGGITVGVFIVVIFFGFGLTQAVAITNLLILSCAATRYFYTLNWMNPDKPYVVLVDYSIATILMVACLAGN